MAILDLIAKKNGDLGQPTHLTGSVAREPAMEEYSLESKGKTEMKSDLKKGINDINTIVANYTTLQLDYTTTRLHFHCFSLAKRNIFSLLICL